MKVEGSDALRRPSSFNLHTSSLPLVQSTFHPPVLLRNRHVQTILPALLQRRCRIPFERERLELPDGDFLDLDWSKGGNTRLAILTHGLEGSSEAAYVRGMAQALSGVGWDILAWNFRGCGQEPNRLVRFYHSGETGDIAAVVRHAGRGYERLALIGFSLGGNVTLKYLGEGPLPPVIAAAAAISTPVDLTTSALALDGRRGNRIYLRRFLQTLIAKVEAKARRFPAELNVEGARQIRTFHEFDNRYTAPLHGFRDADDYWAQASARPFLSRITVPTLLLNACDDPFLTRESLPYGEAEANPSLFLETPAYGGHVGFLDLAYGIQPWSERRVIQFLNTACLQPLRLERASPVALWKCDSSNGQGRP
jgi:predicted alpha/beta-fold hydrolase